MKHLSLAKVLNGSVNKNHTTTGHKPRKENNWKTKEMLERAVVTLEMEQMKGFNP